MDKIFLNNGDIALEIPAGFEEMSDEELRMMGGARRNDNCVIKNDEHSLIYNIAWKKIPLLGKKMDLDAVINTTEMNFSRVIPEYEKVLDVDSTISGHRTKGFRYNYVSNENAFTSEYLMVKTKKQYIVFICTGPTATYEELYPMYQAMLDSTEIFLA